MFRALLFLLLTRIDTASNTKIREKLFLTFDDYFPSPRPAFGK